MQNVFFSYLNFRIFDTYTYIRRQIGTQVPKSKLANLLIAIMLEHFLQLFFRPVLRLQCDQIWRNFVTLAKSSVLGIIVGVFTF